MELNEIRRQFIADLRAGYPQARGHLHTNDGYCCLGIATEITCGIKPDEVLPNGHRRFAGSLSVLPDNVTERLGFLSDTGTIDRSKVDEGVLPGDRDGHLMSLNDTHLWTFDQIADFIETYPKAVFK